MSTTSLFMKSFFKQLLKHPIKPYFSLPYTIQSSVGLIFRISDIKSKKIENISQFYQLLDENNNSSQQDLQNHPLTSSELLFVQRAGYHTDRNACNIFLLIFFQYLDNIVFPGGQCDNGQTDKQACQRQLQQQINIKVKQQCIYIGQLPSNFYYLKKRNKSVFISCHIYVLKSSFLDFQPQLNLQQLIKYKWVKIIQLINKQNYKIREELKLGVFDRMNKITANLVKSSVKNVKMPELDLKMDRNLWGLTLWIWAYVMQMSIKGNQNNQINQINKQIMNKQQIQQLQYMVDEMKRFDLFFKPNSIVKYPVTVIAKGWHYFYRVRPFTYNSNVNKDSINNMSMKLVVLFSILAICGFFSILL